MLFIRIVDCLWLPEQYNEGENGENDCEWEEYDTKDRSELRIEKISCSEESEVLDCEIKSDAETVFDIFTYKVTKFEFALSTADPNYSDGKQ